jgi:hypothetical protein
MKTELDRGDDTVVLYEKVCALQRHGSVYQHRCKTTVRTFVVAAVAISSR